MKKRLVLMLIIVGVVASSAWAIPTWRGTEGTTFQEWYFLDGDNPAKPDWAINPYASNWGYDIEATITHAGTTGNDPTWSDGVWSGNSVKFVAEIPNTQNTSPSSYKDIVIEIGYRGNISLTQVKVGEVAYSRWQRETETYLKGGEIWNIVRDYYHIEPNPTSELLCSALGTFSGDQMQQLDYVVVDTICAVPVPGAILLGSIGVSLVGWMKRRKTL